MTGPSSFLTLLDLKRLDGDRFLSCASLARTRNGRMFGGQVAAQALHAALHTVSEPRQPHSLHSYFIRPGQPEEPLCFEVARTRDGHTFSTRTVTAVQDGKPIFAMIASFQDPEPGEDWQTAESLRVPAPEDLQSVSFARLFGERQPVDIRPVIATGPRTFPLPHPFWVRATLPAGTGSGLHACVLTYLSDVGVVGAARAPHAQDGFALMVSLDHSIWFHRPARMDQWHLYDMSSVAHIGARGLAQGSMRTADGTHVASVAQEVLLRR